MKTNGAPKQKIGDLPDLNREVASNDDSTGKPFLEESIKVCSACSGAACDGLKQRCLWFRFSFRSKS